MSIYHELTGPPVILEQSYDQIQQLITAHASINFVM